MYTIEIVHQIYLNSKFDIYSRKFRNNLHFDFLFTQKKLLIKYNMLIQAVRKCCGEGAVRLSLPIFIMFKNLFIFKFLNFSYKFKVYKKIYGTFVMTNTSMNHRNQITWTQIEQSKTLGSSIQKFDISPQNLDITTSKPWDLHFKTFGSPIQNLGIRKSKPWDLHFETLGSPLQNLGIRKPTPWDLEPNIFRALESTL